MRIPGIGRIKDTSAIIPLARCDVPGQGRLEVGKNGVTALAVNRGGEFVFIARGRVSEVMLRSKVGINPPRFALPPAAIRKPIKGVLLDLDGTCVKSEPLWIGVILQVANEMRRKGRLPPLSKFSSDDLPHVSGRTVPEHLAYVHERYFPKGNTHEARAIYDRITRSDAEMKRIGDELRRHHKSPYEPAAGLRDLLLELRARGVGIAMVTSGLYYKAWPEVSEAFRKIRLGNPLKFLDALVTAGTKIEKGQAGTMGDAIAKPWPNIYFEPARALGFTPNDAAHFVAVGDSASDVGSARTMGVAIIGVEGGNIREAGVTQLCWKMARDLNQVGEILRPNL